MKTERSVQVETQQKNDPGRSHPADMASEAADHEARQLLRAALEAIALALLHGDQNASSIIVFADPNLRTFTTSSGRTGPEKQIHGPLLSALQEENDMLITGQVSDVLEVPGQVGTCWFATRIVGARGEAVGALAVQSVDDGPNALQRRHALTGFASQVAALVEFFNALANSQIQLSAATHKSAKDRELLDLVLKGGALGLWDLHVPTGVWTVNAREHEILGYADAEVSPDTLNWKGLIHPDDWPALDSAMQAHLKGLTALYECAHRIRHRTGNWLWVVTRAVVVERDIAGNPVRIVGTHCDITTQKAIEDDQKRATERLQLALAGGDLGLWDLHIPSGKAVYSQQWWSMFGYAEGELEVEDGFWKSLVHPDDWARARAGLDAHIRGESAMYECEVRMRHKDGHWVWILDRAKVVERSDDGRAIRVVGTNMNISERKLAELRSAESEELLRGVTDNLPVLIAELDMDGRFRFCNATYFNWLGVLSSELLGRTVSESVGQAYYETRREQLAEAYRGQKVSFESMVELPGGPRCLQTTYIPHFDTAGAMSGVYALTTDVSDAKKKERQLDVLARIDPLTGVANRRNIEERIRDAMARTRRSGISIALLFLDVDRFKLINDTYGHAAGDLVLETFARRLRSCIRDTDVVGRLAGDEFLILLEGLANVSDTTTVAEKISSAMQVAIDVGPSTRIVQTSIGIAVYSGEDEEMKSIVQRADRALYSAKGAGGNCYRMSLEV